MKLSKFSNIITVVVFVFLCCSCNDFLEQIPKSAISPETYLTNASHLETYTNGMYAGIIPTPGPWGDAWTDNSAYRSTNANYTPGEMRVPQSSKDSWNFDNIYQCNYFLKHVLPRYEAGSISGVANNIKHYIGEIYFLRACEYFSRLRALGDFPIMTELMTDEMDVLIEASKRSPRNEVARFILSDLDRAIEMMEVSIDARKTRLNKRTALLFKSRVALYEGTFLKYFKGTAFVPNGTGWPGAEKDYNKNYTFPSGSIDAEIAFFLDVAIDASKQVADMVTLTENSGYVQQDISQPGNPYMDMFASINPSSYDEVLLWREYNYNLGLAHQWGNHGSKANQGLGLTRGYIESFLMKNGLPIYAAGSGYHGDDYIADVRADRDHRLFLFLKEPGQINVLTFYDHAYGDWGWPIEPVPNFDRRSGNDGNMDFPSTGYQHRKHCSFDQIHMGWDCAFTGIVVFRGVEALLNYIEAWYEKNGSLNSTAIGYWQAIRARANMDIDINKTIAATEMAKEANDWGAYSAGQLIDPTLYNIRRERRCELLAEGFRSMDLQRWRAYDQMIATPYHVEGFKLWGPMKDWYKDERGNSTLIYGLDNPSAYVSPPDRSIYIRPYELNSNSIVLNGYRWHMAHYLGAIPIREFLLTSSNGNDLTTSPIYQNPGWPLEAGQGPK